MVIVCTISLVVNLKKYHNIVLLLKLTQSINITTFHKNNIKFHRAMVKLKWKDEFLAESLQIVTIH